MLSASFVMAYSAQVALLAAATGLVLAATARRLPQLRLAAWRGVLIAAWLLPSAAIWPPRSTEAAPAATHAGIGGFAVLGHGVATAGEAPAIDWTFWLTVAIATGAVVRLAMLGAGVRRLRRATRALPDADCPLFEHLRARFGVEARLIWHPAIAHPFTFGGRPAIVVVPGNLASESEPTRRAVFTHELLHVARRDWRWMLAEDIAAAPLWFHPAVWAARRELRQAREELVDRATVVETGARRPYAELLLALAERPAGTSAASLPFFTARQLPRRIAALLSEQSMSATRRISSCALVILVCAFGLALSVHAVPLPPVGWVSELAASPQAASTGPGPLERTAYVAPRDMAPPPRVTYSAPAIPVSFADMGDVAATLRLVLDAQGRVVEARALDLRAKDMELPRVKELDAALMAAVRRWRFEPPAAAPVAVTVNVTLVPTPRDGTTMFSLRERPIPIVLKQAVYPDVDRRAGTSGTAEVEVTVDAAGRVSATRLVNATTAAMGAAAIAALEESTFQPGMLDGKAVPVVVTLTMRFELR